MRLRLLSLVSEKGRSKQNGDPDAVRVHQGGPRYFSGHVIKMRVPWELLVCIIIVETCAAASLRRAVDTPSWLMPGVLLYGTVGYILYKIEERGISLAITNALWNASSTVTFTMLSVFFFGVSLTTRQWVGVILAFFGCVLAS